MKAAAPGSHSADDGSTGMAARPSQDVLLARLRRAQEVAHIGSWEIDLRARRMWASEEAFRIYGVDLHESQYLPLEQAQVVPLPEYRALLDRALADLIAGRAPYDVEFEIRRVSDGQVRVIHSLADVIHDPDGRPVAVAGTLQDVTARRHMEAAVRESAARFRMILEHSVDAIILYDAGGLITEANTRACDLTGYGRGELLGRAVATLFSDAELARAPLRFDLLNLGQPVIAERAILRRDRTLVSVEIHSKKLPNGSYQSIFRDIRDRLALEEQLRRRQRMDSIGTLASGMAHDFNNILASVLGYAELLNTEAHGLTEPCRDAVQQILNAGRRAADLTGRLLALSKPDDRPTEDFDLHRVVSDAVKMLAETIDRRIAVRLLVPPGTFFVRGRESDVYHALVNLAINGVQAIEAKGPSDGDALTILANGFEADVNDRRQLSPGRYVHLTVADTGIGMSPEVRAQAFDPLFTTKERGTRRGQGLGLTMVYQVVVRQHGGAIHMESTEGCGTTFHLYLPAGTAECANRFLAESSPEALAERAGRILVVEDEPAIAGLLKTVLERDGHQVIVAGDGVEALDVFRRDVHGFHLVILDRSLPRMHGSQVLQTLLELRPDIKVILSSGDRAANDGAAAAAFAILPKPYPMLALKRAVNLALSAGKPDE